MRHADLRRESTAVIAKPASALLNGMIRIAVWYLVWVWACWCLFGGGTSDAMGKKNTCKNLRLSFSTGFASRKLVRKKLSRKESPIWASVEKGRFRLTNSTV